MSWEDAWNESRTPWDAGESPPILKTLVDEGDLPEGRVLVPGCGSGYDVLTLAGSDRRALGIDIAPRAAERFEQLREEAGLSPEYAEMRVGDALEMDVGESFDMIWEYTFLCALEPERREDWAEWTRAQLRSGGELVMLMFPVDDLDRSVSPDEDGPPYRMTPDFVSALLEPDLERLERRPVGRSHPSREGYEWLGRWRKP